MKYFVTVPSPERFSNYKAVEVEADDVLWASTKAIGCTVWTEEEWLVTKKRLADLGIEV